MRTKAIGLITVAIATLSVSSACTAAVNPVQPSSVPSPGQAAEGMVVLSIRVLDREDQASGIGQAQVYVDGFLRTVTDATGATEVRVRVMVPVSVDIRAAGYQAMGADVAEVRGPERWTFYLERQ